MGATKTFSKRAEGTVKVGAPTTLQDLVQLVGWEWSNFVQSAVRCVVDTPFVLFGAWKQAEANLLRNVLKGNVQAELLTESVGRALAPTLGVLGMVTKAAPHCVPVLLVEDGTNRAPKIRPAMQLDRSKARNALKKLERQHKKGRKQRYVRDWW